MMNPMGDKNPVSDLFRAHEAAGPCETYIPRDKAIEMLLAAIQSATATAVERLGGDVAPIALLSGYHALRALGISSEDIITASDTVNGKMPEPSPEEIAAEIEKLLSGFGRN